MAKKISNEVFQEAAERQEKVIQKVLDVKAKEEDGYDGFTDEKVKLIPTPNFTSASSVGTLLPINMANEIVTNVSKIAQEIDLVEFVRQKLNYSSKISVVQSFSSEQIDALCLAIKSFEKGNGFILGDMAGIGKGRICAGVMRYALQNGLLPIFFTHRPYLFSDIYRDIKEIGFFGKQNKKDIPFSPFIFNGLEKSGETSIIDKELDKVIVQPLITRAINRICESMKLPDEFNSVFLTYSQVSQSKPIKQAFLEELAPNSIIIFDESHNAASANKDARVLKSTIPLVQKSKGVLFSSATYAKSPSVFSLYVVKTALRSAVASLDLVTDALRVGGENVSEYIASGLAAEGQMIRRDRSFGDCKKVSEYVGTIKDTTTGDILSNDDTIQKRLFDEAIGYFKEMRDFARSEEVDLAIKNSVLRTAASNYDLADANEYNDLVGGYTDADLENQREYINRNRNKWVLVKYTKDSISRYKATFRENLLLSIKAKFAADKIIECLNTPVEYKNLDGSVHYTPLKPLIAIKNTSETLFEQLDLEEGQELQNDFSTYLKVVYRKLFKGKYGLRKVNNYLFSSIKELQEKGIVTEANLDRFVFNGDYLVEEFDFFDGGERVREIQSRLEAYNTEDLPLSAIDYLRQRIESERRSGIYFKDATRRDILYGNAGSEYYKVEEATGRNGRIVYDADNDIWVYETIKKKSTTEKFTEFNRGDCDVLLLNVTASTGGSAQSSPKEGKDTRPRNMFIVQFEADINVEIQKRGRINRTGQLNSPVYTYIITQIPVEKRTYLMFRKKLRKLDANTSANQTASVETSEVLDMEGNPIEDIFNGYGFYVFQNDFIQEPEFSAFQTVYNSMKTSSERADGEAAKIEINVENFNAFVRELEYYPVEKPESILLEERQNNIKIPFCNQKEFFDEMNARYTLYIQNLKALNQYQAELEAKNYKAYLKQRVVIKLNSGESVFSMPLYMTDYYTLSDKKPWIRDKVMQKADELLTVNGNLLSPEIYMQNLVEDFDEKASKYLEETLETRKQQYEPKREDFLEENAFIEAKARFDNKTNDIRQEILNEQRYLISMLRFFTPKMPVSDGRNFGMFLGYKFLDRGTKFKYTEGSIEMYFAFLTEFPILRLKLSQNYDNILRIKSETRGLNYYNTPIPPDPTMGINLAWWQSGYEKKQRMISEVEEWRPNLNERIIRRFFSGNILTAVIEAHKKMKEMSEKLDVEDKDRRANQTDLQALTQQIQESLPEDINLIGEGVDDDDVPKNRQGKSKGQKYREFLGWNLSRFLMLDGSIETAVELEMSRRLYEEDTIEADSTSLSVSVGNKDFLDFLNKYPTTEGQEKYPLWNIPNEKIDDRILNIFKYKDIFQVEIMQPYKFKKLRNGSIENLDYLPDERNTKYCNLFHDNTLLQQFSKYQVKNGTDYEQIDYAKIIIRTKIYGTIREEIKRGTKLMKVRIKSFVFSSNEEKELQRFLERISQKYDLAFNFRSSDEAYYNIDTRADIFDPSLKQQETQYPKGQYKYEFISQVNENFISQIPDLLESDKDLGDYGGVILEQPLKPSMLASYKLIPTVGGIPNEVLVNLTIAQIPNDTDRVDFIRGIEEKALLNDMSVGLFVNDFLTYKVVELKYFFGDLTILQIGKLFREYALKNDIEAIVLKKEDKKETKPRKTQIDFFGAEQFLIQMITQ